LGWADLFFILPPPLMTTFSSMRIKIPAHNDDGDDDNI